MLLQPSITPGQCLYQLCRVRLANFLAPVSSEANLGGPLGWIADYADNIGVSSIFKRKQNTLW